MVVIETSMGTIRAELFEDKSPVTVKNFLGYVDDKFYDGTVFHRVMGRENSRADFIIQGGGYEPGMKEKKARPPIESESANGLKNVRGTLAMARKSQANSATCQFFINVADNESLDRDKAADEIGQCVFGKVIDGLTVVDKIKSVKTTVRGQNANVPVEDIIIKSIRREEPTKPVQ
ncbi:MAG: peptidylprolyl isomerase [Gemmataceae bacterium]|nr:peptidylprolyl isomerase [Gemmataceae bacterium]